MTKLSRDLFLSKNIIDELLNNIEQINASLKCDFSKRKIRWPTTDIYHTQSLNRSLFAEIRASNPYYLFNNLLKLFKINHLSDLIRVSAVTIYEVLFVGGVNDPDANIGNAGVGLISNENISNMAIGNATAKAQSLIVNNELNASNLMKLIPPPVKKSIDNSELDLSGILTIIVFIVSNQQSVNSMPNDLVLSIYFNSITSNQHLWMKQLGRLIDIGYTFHYFNFVNPEHFLFLTHLGKIQLTPENFESAATAKLNDYEQCISTISNLMPCQSYSKLLNCEVWSHKRRFGGWRKKDLVDAIRKMGLIEISPRKLLSNVNHSDIVKVETELNKKLRRPTLGQIKKSRCISKVYYYPLPAFGTKAYNKKCYYEHIYRCLYHTTKFFNWSKIVAGNLVPINTVQFILNYEFNIPFSTIIHLTPKDFEYIFNQLQFICKNIHKELGQIGPALILQPGSWITYADLSTRHLFKNTDDNQRYSQLLTGNIYCTLQNSIKITESDNSNNSNNSNKISETDNGSNSNYSETDDQSMKYSLIQLIKDMDLEPMLLQKGNYRRFSTLKLVTIITNYLGILLSTKNLQLAS